MSFARVRALAIVGVLVTCAAVLVAVTLFNDKQRGPITTASCPKDAVVADVRMPEPKDVKVNFFDGTGTASVAFNVGEDLKHRQFQITKKDTVTPIKQVAVLRYGPKAVGAAWLLKAYFLNDAKLASQFDIKRTDDTVDLVLGSAYKSLATETQVGQALAQLGRPSSPPGTCPNDPAQ